MISAWQCVSGRSGSDVISSRLVLSELREEAELGFWMIWESTIYREDGPLLWTIAAVVAALAIGTVVRIVALRGAATDLVQARLSSLKTWWILAVILSVAVICRQTGVAILLASVAILGLREFVGLLGWSSVGRPSTVIVFAFVPAYYALLLLGNESLLRPAAPVAFLVALGGLRASLGLVEGFIRTTAALSWGLMLMVYCLSHAAMLLTLESQHVPFVGRAGWFLFLILLTETNDIMQAIIGRRFGRTKITPRVSPNKSLEGLLGGMTVTVAIAVVMAPWLTGLTAGRSMLAGVGVSLLAGVLISLFGFLGDINMSGVKRDVGVKDGSQLLPGQGGMIDRIDSLTFTAPIFYYFVRLVM